jgi:hypothetical protein
VCALRESRPPFSLGDGNKITGKIVVKRTQSHHAGDARHLRRKMLVLARNRSAHNSVDRSGTDQRFLTTLHFNFTRLIEAVSSGSRVVILRPSDPPGDRQGNSLLHRSLNHGCKEKGEEEGWKEKGREEEVGLFDAKGEIGFGRFPPLSLRCQTAELRR